MAKHIQTQTEWESTMARRIMEQLRGELYLDQRYLNAALGALPPAPLPPGTTGAAFALIPTMILQPVLENALVHGVRTDHAVVDISARDEGDRLVICVKDNGEGMPSERVDRILNGSAEESEQQGRKSTGIGMRNVRDRLRLIYGSAAELRIESRLGEGTAVTVLLPLACEEEEWNLHCGQDE